MGYALDTTFTTPVVELDPFRNLHTLLAEGQNVPLKHYGKKVGIVISCIVCPERENDSKVKMKIKFLLDKPLDFEILEIVPICVSYRVQERSVYKLLTHFLLITGKRLH